jgi:aminoglycoside/choline kinase family phosphotransferase
MAGQLSELIAAKVRTVFGARAALISLSTLAGDASSRRYHRVGLQGPGVPNSLIVMELCVGSSLPLSTEELAIFKTPPKELPFLSLHRFLSRIGVRVPRLYGHWEREGILLLEDVGDTALWNRVQGLSPGATEIWYQKAIDELLVLQIRGTQQLDPGCVAFQQRFDARLYMWEFDHFLEYGLKRRPGTRVRSETIAALRKVFVDVAGALERQPPCLNHRDYHSWNLMIHEGAVVVIDFQDALLAPPQYDLASLLNDRETDRVITPEMEARLIRYYRDNRAAKSRHSNGADEFKEIYLLSTIQRDLKVVGRFYYLDIVKGKPGYKQFIPPTLRRLKRNLARLPQLERIIPLLAEYYEEMQ